MSPPRLWPPYQSPRAAAAMTFLAARVRGTTARARDWAQRQVYGWPAGQCWSGGQASRRLMHGARPPLLVHPRELAVGRVHTTRQASERHLLRQPQAQDLQQGLLRHPGPGAPVADQRRPGRPHGVTQSMAGSARPWTTPPPSRSSPPRARTALPPPLRHTRRGLNRPRKSGGSDVPRVWWSRDAG